MYRNLMGIMVPTIPLINPTTRHPTNTPIQPPIIHSLDRWDMASRSPPTHRRITMRTRCMEVVMEGFPLGTHTHGRLDMGTHPRESTIEVRHLMKARPWRMQILSWAAIYRRHFSIINPFITRPPVQTDKIRTAHITLRTQPRNSNGIHIRISSTNNMP